MTRARPSDAPGVEAFADALDRVAAGLHDMGHGRAEAFAACWTQTPHASLYGGFGTRELGPDRVRRTLHAVAARFRGGALVPEYDRVDVHGTWALTAGFERGVLSVDGSPLREFSVRVTHVYGLEDGRWLLTHRHGDHGDHGLSAAPPSA